MLGAGGNGQIKCCLRMILTRGGVNKVCAFEIRSKIFMLPVPQNLYAVHNILSRSTLRIISMSARELDSARAFCADKKLFPLSKAFCFSASF